MAGHGPGRAAAWELVALVLALDERERLEPGERRRLDREIGVRAGDRRGLALLRFWLHEAPGSELAARIERVRHALSLLGWLFLAIGFFLGWGAASALLQIEVHEGRINIVLCLGLLVVAPLGLLLASLAGLAWSLIGVDRRAPATPGTWLRELGLGRLAMRLVGPSIRSDFEVLLGRLTAHRRLYGRVQRLLLMGWSQRVGLGFAAGALVAAFAFVVFTDLAFGWSTTLEVDARTVHRLLALVAAPWAALWPAASPSLELVEATRHFRVAADDHTHLVDPIVYGGWWPFLVMAIGVYGLLPRLVVLAGVARGLRREAGRAMLLTPGVDRLVDRLRTPRVESRAEQGEGDVGHPASGLVPEVEAARHAAAAGAGPGAPVVVRWAEVADETSLAALLGVPAIRSLEAGGRRSLEEDAAAIRSAAVEPGALFLAVRAYEPALLDQLDFLAALREAIGRERAVCVLLVDGRRQDHEAWRRKLVGLGDPALRVARGATVRPATADGTMSEAARSPAVPGSPASGTSTEEGQS